MTHRLRLASIWDIRPSSRVLEIGCGQGDCTIVLADAVGPDGHVDAVDPGAGDYGSPFTLSEAQAHILASPLGPRISFHTTINPIDFLGTHGKQKYDFIILSHCIYYFASPAVLPILLSAFKPHCHPGTKLCVAEWSLSSQFGGQSAVPHVLTALLLTLLEGKRKAESSGNIRTVLSPHQIKQVAEAAGFKIENDESIRSHHGLLDGHWEVSDLLRRRETEVERMEHEGLAEAEVVAMEAGYDAVEAAVAVLQETGQGVKCMDVWIGVFGLEGER